MLLLTLSVFQFNQFSPICLFHFFFSLTLTSSLSIALSQVWFAFLCLPLLAPLFPFLVSFVLSLFLSLCISTSSDWIPLQILYDVYISCTLFTWFALLPVSSLQRGHFKTWMRDDSALVKTKWLLGFSWRFRSLSIMNNACVSQYVTNSTEIEPVLSWF